MKITIVPSDGIVGIDGVFRAIDLDGIDPEIHAVQFDTQHGSGTIEYIAGAVESMQVRDHQAEDAAWAAAREAGQPESAINIPVMMKTMQMQRPPVEINDLSPFQVFLDRWTAAGQ